MAPQAVVFTNPDGSGLTGGANEETDAEWQAALLALSQRPPRAGNESEVLRAVYAIQGIAIQAVFVVPAVAGPGTKSVIITMRPPVRGGSRIPNNAHLSLVEASLKAVFAADDGIVMVSLVEQPVQPVLRVSWKTGAVGWADLSPWPGYYSPNVKVTNAVAIGATAFRVTSAAVVAAPSVGKTIALYDPVGRAFVPKRIASVTQISATHTWDLTFETSVPTSDVAFVPANGAIVSPWSESMNDLVTPVLDYVDRQGPGEMFAEFDDPGRRRRRVPEPGPDAWPSKIENRLLDGVFAVAADASIAEPSIPYPTTVGVPPAVAYLHRATDLAIFPQ